MDKSRTQIAIATGNAVDIFNAQTGQLTRIIRRDTGSTSATLLTAENGRIYVVSFNRNTRTTTFQSVP